jgi:inner membrane protein
MDSLTQIVLGASVAALAVPAPHRRRAVLAGAVLGTLPDLDSFPLKWMGADAVTLVTWHRGPSHSLPVLTLLGLLIWWLLRRWWGPVREAPRHWLAAIWLALLTHPLLDAFTVYGTQLWWPLPPQPTMWSSIFIIDPAYTLPLLVGVVAVLALGMRAPGRRFLVAGLALSSAYLGWSLLAKQWVEREAEAALAPLGLAQAPRFSVPMPFSTALWRVAVLTPDGMLEGYRSLAADRGPMRFARYPHDGAALRALADTPAVQRLLWFSSGFMKADAQGDRLVLSDVRMGVEGAYTFQYLVAERATPTSPWQAVTPLAITTPADRMQALRAVWQRMWHEPTPGEPPFSLAAAAAPAPTSPPLAKPPP